MPYHQARRQDRRRRSTAPHKSDRGPVPASASVRPDCPRHRRARGFWSSVRRGIGRSLAGRFFSRTGAVLMRTHDGGVDHHVLVVVIARQQLENTLENPSLGPSAKALVDDFPVTETLRKITPWDTRPISEQNGFHEQPVIRRRAPDMAFAAGQKILD